MLYSTFLVLLGIYIGQENPDLPRIKTLSSKIIKYIIDNFSDSKDENSLFKLIEKKLK